MACFAKRRLQVRELGVHLLYDLPELLIAHLTLRPRWFSRNHSRKSMRPVLMVSLTLQSSASELLSLFIARETASSSSNGPRDVEDFADLLPSTNRTVVALAIS